MTEATIQTVDCDADDLGMRATGLTSLQNELTRLGKRWTRLDNVPFGPELDADHVLLSAAGVFAVEIKFTASAWSPSSSSFLRAVGEARDRARKVMLLLDRAGKPTVTPMLIVWGPGAPEIPGGYETIAGVLVCRGVDAAQWLAYLKALPATLQPACVTELVDMIIDHTNRTNEVNRALA